MGWRWPGPSNSKPASVESARFFEDFALGPDWRGAGSRARLEELVEPIHDPPRTVALIFRAGESVSLVGIDHQLVFHPESLQRVPELVGLRRRHFGIPL